MRRSSQIRLDFRGRKTRTVHRKKPGPKRTSRNVAHGTRRKFAGLRPMHVTLRMDRSVPRLRNGKRHRVLCRVFCKLGDDPRFRLVHYSLQRNHLHFIVEAADRACMTRGMRRLGIRVALQLNKAMGRRKGRVLSDRYDEQHLQTPTQVKHALGYVLCNFRRHYWKEEGRVCEQGWLDPYSSAVHFDGWEGDCPPAGVPPDGPVVPPKTWLVRTGWRRLGLISIELVPGGKPNHTSRSRPVRYPAHC